MFITMAPVLTPSMVHVSRLPLTMDPAEAAVVFVVIVQVDNVESHSPSLTHRAPVRLPKLLELEIRFCTLTHILRSYCVLQAV